VSACVHICMYVCINYINMYKLCINYTNDAVLDEHIEDLCPSIYCHEVDGCVCVSVCVRERERGRKRRRVRK